MNNIITISDLNKKIDRKYVHTTASLRRDVRTLIKQANQIIYESGDSKKMQKNIDYFLRDFHKTTRGGITSNISTEHLTKKQARRLYNELSNFIGADDESKTYKKYEKKHRADVYKKIQETMKDSYDTDVSYEDIDELFAIKDMYPELFNNEDAFYLSIIEGARTEGKKGRSIMQTVVDVKKEFKESGIPYTDSDIKTEIIKRANIKDLKP